ncbi:PAS domain-containing hybrid sensor histidine kinase/response regulator [Aquabacterium humicola]|uniref:PAS domain-containing hybrid sensor histidine kinase/response regulator n=1 Tax=Aquabacterium humicola TaxID=3237377 RepID=UPI002542C3C9|nr:PAS domain S-box protein [Rubrivivax pictus]
MRAAILRGFFIAAAAAAVVGFLSHLLRLKALTAPGLLLAAGYAVLAVGSGAATRLAPAQAQRALLAVAVGALVVMGSAALATGLGLQSPGLLFFGLLACLVCAVAEGRQGPMTAAGATAVLAVLIAAEASGFLPPGGDSLPPLPVRALVQLAAVGIGAGAGHMIRRLVLAHGHDAGERERRFRGLLGIAASAYWETDAQLRLAHVSQRDAHGQFVALRALPRRPAWDLPELQFDDDLLDTLRADMEARETFRDVALTWRAPNGDLRHFLVSGEPRLDAEGRFTGYWGAARDITAERRARETLQATELRHEELFRRTPSPLVLHRDGVVIDANPAAAALFGFDSAQSMQGADLTAMHPPGDGALRARERLSCIAQLAPGEALPPFDDEIVTRGGRTLQVTETAVRADAQDEPATLSIYVDETSQQAAERALRRSQALLSQVVSMSPDVITLTDLQTGRYEMVNASFERLTGWTEPEVVGRTALEIGIWRSLDDRQHLMQQLAQHDAVSDVPVDFVGRDGQIVPLLVSAARFARDGRGYLVINARDITETTRTRLEREAILDNASVGIAFTRERQFVMVNPCFEQMYGWPPGELVGQPGRVVWPSDDAYAGLGQSVAPLLRRGEQVEFERVAMRRDGSTFTVRMRAKAIDPDRPGENGTIWIAEDVTAQRQAAEALARARDEAEAANRAKSAFLANTSHEIRTPLNGLVGLARLARMPDVEPGRLRQYLEQIGASAETLSAIISDILDLSKIEAGKLDVEAAPFDLLELLHSLQQAYSALADSRGLEFSVEIDPGLAPVVRGDALRVRQILANFLHNALKFTSHGALRLVARRLVARPGDNGHGLDDGGDDGDQRTDHTLDDWVRFEVHDTGIGIDSAMQQRLFQPFTQADESITRRFGGTGLGLSICRELAELMGGQVGAESQPGRGSCFHAELPLPPIDELDASSGHGAFEHDPLRGARVLLVEDNAVNMMIAAAMLEQWGVQVGQAADGPQALAAIERAVEAGQPYDAVLMDVQMPGMSGYEATRRLRERWSLLQLPIIALTAAALTSERERAAEIGMNDFLTKPIDANRLRTTLQRVLAAGELASDLS